MPVIPEQVAWTTLPTAIESVARARRRWQHGLVSAFRRNPDVLGNPEFGAFGLVALPYTLVAVIIAPFVELAGYVLLLVAVLSGAVGASFVVAYLAAVLGYGILLSVWTVILYALTFERSGSRSSIPRLIGFAIVEAFGYRQLMAWYRATALFIVRTPTHSHGQSTTESPA